MAVYVLLVLASQIHLTGTFNKTIFVAITINLSLLKSLTTITLTICSLDQSNNIVKMLFKFSAFN